MREQSVAGLLSPKKRSVKEATTCLAVLLSQNIIKDKLPTQPLTPCGQISKAHSTMAFVQYMYA